MKKVSRACGIAGTAGLVCAVLMGLGPHSVGRGQPEKAPPSSANAPPANPPASRAQPALPAAVTPAQNLFGWLAELERLLVTRPAGVRGLTGVDLPAVVKVANSIEQWSVEVARMGTAQIPAEGALSPVQATELLKQTGYLLIAKQKVDRQLAGMLELRVQFADWPVPDEAARSVRQAALITWLQINTTLIDLAGRLRYLQRDAVEGAANALAEQPADYEQLLDICARYESSIAAIVLADAVIDPVPREGEQLAPLDPRIKLKILRMAAATRAVDLFPTLVEVLKTPAQPPAVRLAAVQAIRAVGLPQPPRADDEEYLPAITPAQCYEQLSRIPRDQLSAAEQAEFADLRAWLDQRMRRGVTEPAFRYGPVEVMPGDWLLMRNPSPYNMLTELSPGLFTHVGVVAEEKDADGQRRMVIVDLPERGSSIPATNVDSYLSRTLHYCFLRHEDPRLAAKIGSAAAECIGNPSSFDLNFRTDRVYELRDKPLRGTRIHTYCAGFLLLCSQTTGRPREEFFPISESGSIGLTQKNFAQLGLAFGEDFISPTGALLAPRMQWVGQREPMYDPRREVEEAIFDHFAMRCRTVPLNESPDALQSLRTKLAQASTGNPLLAQALANTANVSAQMDLVAAAKTGAVVETLDEIAFGNSRDYANARLAILEGPNPPSVAGRTREQVAALAAARTTHAALAARWDAEQLSPRALRLELVAYYIARGQRQLDERFFQEK
ncbi:MAG: hypothetical protein SFX18_00940 [Pirellulales bacterium]|nr:hypothetical protein [Pirellulales bacterium]